MSTQPLITFLGSSIALLSALLLLLVVRRLAGTGRPAVEVARDLIKAALRPLLGTAAAAVLLAILYFATSREFINPASTILLHLVLGALAVVPPWLPTLKSSLIGTLVFYLAGAFTSSRLLLPDSEGPEAMGVFLWLGIFWLLFFASLALRIVIKACSLVRNRRNSLHGDA